MPSETGAAAAPLHDAHCHFLSRRFFDVLGREKFGAEGSRAADRAIAAREWEPPGTADALAARWIAELDKARVARAALMASVPGDEESVAAAVARYPRRIVGLFVVNAAAADAEERARRGFAELGLGCICLFPAMHRYRLDDDRVARLFAVAAEHRGAVFVHCGFLSIEARANLGLRSGFDVRFGDPLALAVAAAPFPTVPVIVPHFGGGLFREALMAAEACPNIVFDTSSSNSWIRFVPGLTLTEVFRRALAVAGADRLLFGTDSSFFPRGWRRVIHGAQEAILHEIGAEPEVRAKIFSGNFERIFDAG
jgi:predicted TIM-barrel fold metal-dependent hydrolase